MNAAQHPRHAALPGRSDQMQPVCAASTTLSPAHVAYCSARAIPHRLAMNFGFSTVNNDEVVGLLGLHSLPSGNSLLIQYPYSSPPYFRARLEDGAWIAMRGRAVPVYYAVPCDQIGDTLFVAEAPPKALAIAAAGYSAIGLGGVLTTLTKTSTGSVLNDSWPDVTGLRVIIVFDANRTSNASVAFAEGRLASAIRRAGASEVLVTLISANADGSDRGPDDFIAELGPDAFSMLAKGAMPAHPLHRVDKIMRTSDHRARSLALRELVSDLPFCLSLDTCEERVHRNVQRTFERCGLRTEYVLALQNARSALTLARERKRTRGGANRGRRNHHGSAPSANTLEVREIIDFALVTTFREAQLVAERIQESGSVGLDLITTNDDSFEGRPRLIQLAFADGSICLIDLDKLRDVSPVSQALESVEVVAHDAHPKLRWLRRHFGMAFRSLFCTRIASQLIEGGPSASTSRHRWRRVISRPSTAFDLPWVLERYLGVDSFPPMDPFLGRWTPSRLSGAAAAVRHLLPLRRHLGRELAADGLESVMFDLEMPAVPVVVDMELRGIPLNVEKWKQLARVLGERKDDAAVKAFLSNQHRKILENVLKHDDGRVRAKFDCMGTVTGRIQASDPPLQTIPKTVDGIDIRRCFAAAEDYCFVVADLSQVELRILAEITKCPALIAAFNRRQDVHKFTAARLLGKRTEDVSEQDRAKAKAIGFGIVYGMSASGLAQYAHDDLGLDFRTDDADAFIERYLNTFPGVRRWRMAMQDQPPRHVRSLSGRLICVDDPMRNINRVLNLPIQATCADALKAIISTLSHSLDGTGAYVVNVLFDEVIVEGPSKRVAEIANIVRGSFIAGMRRYVSSVPIEVTIDIRGTWSAKTTTRTLRC